jgi:glycosyltransferase involved in cell wall biosynthesis
VRIAVLTEAFSKRMGYAAMALPKHLARLGADVHVFTSGLPPYHSISGFASTYGGFSGAEHLSPGTEAYDGYTLHVLPFERQLGYVRLLGLRDRLHALQPDVVQTFTVLGWVALDAAIAQVRDGFALFTGNHTTASVFPPAQPGARTSVAGRLKNGLTRTVPGALVSSRSERCYGATVDCADVAVRFFGVPQRKIAVAPLGVDTDIFAPATSPAAEAARLRHRAQYGAADGDIVCVYTGRLTEDKNPLLLARAVAGLRGAGLPFRGHFVGDGPQAEAIAATPGAVVHPFVHFTELAGWYRAADIGVWPTQESTSMLDAAACGLPLVVNDTIRAVERIRGNGVTYRLSDEADLMRVLRDLMSPERRAALGAAGARRIREEFSWHSLATRRLEDYERVLTRNGRRGAGSPVLGRPESAGVANG